MVRVFAAGCVGLLFGFVVPLAAGPATGEKAKDPSRQYSKPVRAGTKGFFVDGRRDQFNMWWLSNHPQTLIWSNGYGRGGYLQITARKH
jgi:hypothetical protein